MTTYKKKQGNTITFHDKEEIDWKLLKDKVEYDYNTNRKEGKS